jgi:predicted ABC-type ATPase
MIVVAGPPGSGKSTLFPVSTLGGEYFNADDRAAALNGGSYHGISAALRKRVGGEMEAWISQHIVKRESFAIETTLRSAVTFDQARSAHAQGFWTTLEYVCSGSVEESLRRILRRSYRGGHSASEPLIRRIYQDSLHNLGVALEFLESGIELLRVYDNSRFGERPRELLTVRRGQLLRIQEKLPPWLEEILERRR